MKKSSPTLLLVKVYLLVLWLINTPSPTPLTITTMKNAWTVCCDGDQKYRTTNIIRCRHSATMYNLHCHSLCSAPHSPISAQADQPSRLFRDSTGLGQSVPEPRTLSSGRQGVPVWLQNQKYHIISTQTQKQTHLK